MYEWLQNNLYEKKDGTCYHAGSSQSYRVGGSGAQGSTDSYGYAKGYQLERSLCFW